MWRILSPAAFWTSLVVAVFCVAGTLGLPSDLRSIDFRCDRALISLRANVHCSVRRNKEFYRRLLSPMSPLDLFEVGESLYGQLRPFQKTPRGTIGFVEDSASLDSSLSISAQTNGRKHASLFKLNIRGREKSPPPNVLPNSLVMKGGDEPEGHDNWNVNSGSDEDGGAGCNVQGQSWLDTCARNSERATMGSGTIRHGFMMADSKCDAQLGAFGKYCVWSTPDGRPDDPPTL